MKYQNSHWMYDRIFLIEGMEIHHWIRGKSVEWFSHLMISKAHLHQIFFRERNNWPHEIWERRCSQRSIRRWDELILVRIHRLPHCIPRWRRVYTLQRQNDRIVSSLLWRHMLRWQDFWMVLSVQWLHHSRNEQKIPLNHKIKQEKIFQSWHFWNSDKNSVIVWIKRIGRSLSLREEWLQMQKQDRILKLDLINLKHQRN